MKIILFGFGMQGKAAYFDLLKYEKCSTLIVADVLPPPEEYVKMDVTNKTSFEIIDFNDSLKIKDLIQGAGLILDALPGAYAIELAKLAIEAGIHIVSTMYYLNPLEKDPQVLEKLKEKLKALHEEAVRKNITVLPEFGLDPGIDLVLGAKALSEFDEVEVFNSYGAGLPIEENADNPIKYKFSWSVAGLLRAYKRPARLIKNGKVVEIDGMKIFSEENRHFLKINELDVPLESYPNGNSEYYSEIFGLKDSIKEMGRYACRYPGHCDFWYSMANCGFLDEEPLKMDNTEIQPIEFLTKLLTSQKQFQFNENESDFAFIRVEVIGRVKDKRKKIIYHVIDYKDLQTGFTAMQRTVGFTLSLGARLILNGQINKPGLISPIDIPFELLEEGLKASGINIQRFETIISD